ncbi:FAD-dependent oxidoreductase [Aspergillus brunneoviolaceus CBS 621.78]|uniref:FAD dependent oxidoreductase superfamily n=1 Tax=Aspergillus brunneoviolaceus CBS 621.78 TaxID=1450534 RepID=A0ACD1G090_9EURO|nr:FAD dependent oxidoreductase superfamily [Aspergillus brunneoviolaceus CBS 621.78]RAH42617.1 FAD dependent oxidoreductase superfamily [Aspergillus brunneoviolaceus CBS 621.78]
MNRTSVIIVGAGVIGLSSAIRLAQTGHRVTIISKEFPGDLHIDYASPWAGAHFRPVPSTKPEDRLEETLMRETYRELERLSAIHPEASIQFVPGVEFFDVADPAYFDPKLTQENGYASWPGFRVLESREYPQGHESIKLGVTYTAWVLNSPMYLRWLERQAEKLGVQFICRDLVALEEAVFVYREQEYHKDRGILAVVNASGRGFDDPQSYPSRGQFIAVANRCDKTVSHHWSDGSTTVIIPRPLGGGTIIGGTKEPNNWSHVISDNATTSILSRAAALCPELLGGQEDRTSPTLGFDVREVYIARRPMRHGGLRLEKGHLVFQDTAENGMKNEQESVPVVHCYGAGPSGYKLSWGIADRVDDLVSLCIEESQA